MVSNGNKALMFCCCEFRYWCTLCLQPFTGPISEPEPHVTSDLSLERMLWQPVRHNRTRVVTNRKSQVVPDFDIRWEKVVHTKKMVHTRWKKGGPARPQVVPDRHGSEWWPPNHQTPPNQYTPRLLQSPTQIYATISRVSPSEFGETVEKSQFWKSDGVKNRNSGGNSGLAFRVQGLGFRV